MSFNIKITKQEIVICDLMLPVLSELIFLTAKKVGMLIGSCPSSSDNFVISKNNGTPLKILSVTTVY